MYPRLIQRMDAKTVELLGSGGSVMMIQDGETQMTTVIEALEVKLRSMPKKDSLVFLAEELRNTGWGLHRPQ